jgi:5-methylcytosine-specific restriction protein A
MKKPLDAQAIAAQLTDYYGLPLAGNTGWQADGHGYIDLFPEGVHRNDGFTVRLSLGWRSLRGEFIPGSFAGPMIQEMGNASEPDKFVFSELVRTIYGENGSLAMTVNNQDVDPSRPDSWPDQWQRLTLVFEKSPLAVNTEDEQETERALLTWGGRFLAGILALTPLEDDAAEEEFNIEGLPEGAVSRIEVNRYERSKFNRAACIEIHGTTCKACGFDFLNAYGERGRGYIHVHHVTPVSQLGGGYKVNPVTDLLPVCPNCHAMIHRTADPITIEQLKCVIEASDHTV